MANATVAIVRTSPATVLADYHRVMNLAGYRQVIDPAADTALKVNISWHYFFPACSTPPWQLEGVIAALLRDGYARERLYACHNRTVVVSAKRGERANKHLHVVRKYGLRNVHLYDGEEWVNVREAVGDLASRFLVLHKVYPRGFSIPKRFLGANIIHLPTIKTHVFTTITGAMKNAFGGLLNERRHYTHEVIHETLVDLLMIQKRIHRGILAVTDGTFAGDGPGPRCMTPFVKNVLLASTDQVAIDAIAAKLMGFDPLGQIDFVRIAHEMGLGCGDPARIELTGDVELAEQNWHFEGPFKKMTFASKGQHALYWGPLRPVQKILLRTVLQPWAYAASWVYHDWYWYPFVGKKQIDRVMHSDWARLFRNYERLEPTQDGWPQVCSAPDDAAG